MPKIKAFIKRPDEEFGHSTAVSNTLENFQRNVGGYIEAVTLGKVLGKGDLVIICNEEGRLRGLPYNCCICGIDFVGDIVAVGADGDEFCDVPITFAEWKGLIV